MTGIFSKHRLLAGCLGVALTMSGLAYAASPLIPTYPSTEVVQGSTYYVLDQSTTLMDQGRYSEAITLLGKTVEQEPTNIFANFNMGFAYMTLAKLSEEKAQTERAINHKERTDALLAEAQYYFERVQNLNPDLTLSYFKLGKIALMRGDNAAAEAYYKAGIEVEPGNAALAFNLARVYDQIQNNAQAILYYNKAIALDPGFVYAYNNLGLLYEAQKDYKAAERVYKAALKKDPAYNFARLNLGNLYATLERGKEAQALYEEALKYEPSNAWAYLYLGNVHFLNKDFAAASKAYEASVRLNPGFSTGYYLLAVSLSHLEHYDEALNASLHYISMEPDGKYSEQLKSLVLALKLQKAGLTLTEQKR